MTQDLQADALAGPAGKGALELPAPVAAEFVTKPRHFAGFDGLRAIAALLVLLLHTAWVSGFTRRSSLGIYLGRLEIGVSVFFLISGFLLYRPFALSHLSERRSPSVGHFWQRRFLRIVPAYWLALTVLTFVFGITTVGPGWQGFFIHYFFLQIYFPTGVLNGITQAWSLCTEVSFYLFLPLYAALIGLRRRSPRTQLAWELIGLVVLTVISYAFRWWTYHLPILTVRQGKIVAICEPNCGSHATWPALMVAWLPSYLDLFALGMLLAVASAWFSEHDWEPRWLRHRFMPYISWACAAFCFWAVAHVVNDSDILYFVAPITNIERQALYGAFAFFLLIPAVFGPQDTSIVRRLLRSWPMASLGVISYGIYLWHLDLIHLFLRWTGWLPGQEPFWILALVVFCMSVAFASASYFGLERPLLRLKGRISWWDRTSSRRVDGSPAASPLKPAGSHSRIIADGSRPDPPEALSQEPSGERTVPKPGS